MRYQGCRTLVLGGLTTCLALAAIACNEGRGEALSVETTATLATSVEGENGSGDLVEEILSGEQTRRYRLHVPPSYQPGSPMPLVINLHGFTSSAAEQEEWTATSSKADEAGFIVVYPEALGDPQEWHVGRRAQGIADVQFILDLLRHLEEQLSIDSSRIYATGLSNGGGMANRLGCDLSDVIAAIAPVSGAFLFWRDCEPIRPMPVLAFHGTADRYVPYEGDGRSLPAIREWARAWATRNGCDPTPTVTLRQGEVVGETWGGCVGDAVVTLYTMEGGGHFWPGAEPVPGLDTATRDINATDAIWDFFEDHPLP